jgi:hypothetical protein
MSDFGKAVRRQERDNALADLLPAPVAWGLVVFAVFVILAMIAN